MYKKKHLFEVRYLLENIFNARLINGMHEIEIFPKQTIRFILFSRAYINCRGMLSSKLSFQLCLNWLQISWRTNISQGPCFLLMNQCYSTAPIWEGLQLKWYDVSSQVSMRLPNEVGSDHKVIWYASKHKLIFMQNSCLNYRSIERGGCMRLLVKLTANDFLLCKIPIPKTAPW